MFTLCNLSKMMWREQLGASLPLVEPRAQEEAERPLESVTDAVRGDDVRRVRGHVNPSRYACHLPYLANGKPPEKHLVVEEGMGKVEVKVEEDHGLEPNVRQEAGHN